MNTKTYLSYTFVTGQVASGYFNHMYELCTKFQFWARQYVDDETSLACWCANDPAKYVPLHFESTEELLGLAQIGFKKLEGVVIPDLTNVAPCKTNLITSYKH